MTCGRRSKRRPRRGRRASLIVLVLVAFTAVGTAAWAYWTALGSGTGQAASGTLNAPTNLATSASIGSGTVHLTWDGSTLSSGEAAQGYYLTRTRNSDSSTAAACGTSPAVTTSGLSCDDLTVPDGTFHYTVTAVYNSWTATSDPSTNVTVSVASKLVMTSGPVSGAASATATLGPLTVQEQDSLGNPVAAPAGGTTVYLTSDSAGTTIFAATSGGGSVTSVTIPVGLSSTTFWYGDTLAGTPTITASGSLTSATQTEAITAAAADNVAVTSGPASGTASATASLGPFTVQMQDIFGNPVLAPSGGTRVNLLSGHAPTTIFAATSGGGSVTYVTIPVGASSTTFWYGDTLAGTYPLMIYNPALVADWYTMTITAAAANKLAITSGPVSGSASATANLGPLTVQEQDSYGNPVLAPVGGMTVNLASNSAGTKRFAATSGGGSVTSVSISSGSSSTTFWYGDTLAGAPTITASGSLTSATQIETITAAAASKWVISGPVSGSASATANLGPYTLQEQDSFGNPVLAPAGGTTGTLLSNTTGTFIYATTQNGTSVASVTIPEGASSTTFWYGDTKAGAVTLLVYGSGLMAHFRGGQTITAAAASTLAITSSPVAGSASATANLGPITIQEQDSFGNPALAPTGGTTVNLASNSAGTKVFATTQNGTSVTSVNIPAGTSSTTLWYGDTKAATPTITASGSLTSATQSQTITAAAASKLAITSSPVAGSASATANLGPITVQEQDSFGNPALAPAGGTTVDLASNSVGTPVFAITSGGGLVTFVTIAVGASSTTFWYGDTLAGAPTITASGSLISATQTETITAAAASKLAFTTNPIGSSGGTNFATQPVVTVQDAGDNTVTTSSASVTLSITTPAGAILTCTTNPQAATSGVDTFAGCKIDKAGTYTLTAAASGLTPAVSASLTITADTTAPTVTNVTSTLADGAYTTGQVVPVTVTFSENVTVTGTPQLTLSTGTPATTAVDYTSGTGTNELTFNYTVAAGNTSADLDYAVTTSLALNGGTIQDAATNNATLTLAAPAATNSLGANKALVIDTTAPVVTVTKVNASVRTFPYSTNTDVTSIGGVCGTLSGDSGTVSALIDGAATAPPTATCTAGAWNLTLTTALSAQNVYTLSATQADTAGNTGTAPSQTLTIDKTAPTVTGVSSTLANGSYKTGQVIPVTVTFSENVTVTGTPRLTLSTGSPATTAVNYSSGSGTNVLTFNYTIAAGNTSADLDYAATTSLTLNSGTIQDAATNNATLTLASPGAADSLSATKALVIDTTAPTVTGVSSSLANGRYTTGQVVPVTVTFSENVTVTGTPRLTLSTGSPVTTNVNYTSGTGTSTLTFNYTVAAGNTSADLDYALTTSLALNSGTIRDLATNNATLTLASPGAANSLGANKALVIDTTAPTVTGVSSTLANGSYKTGQVIPVTVTFSENVTVTGTPRLTLSTGSPVSTAVNYSFGSGTNVLTFNYTVVAGNTSADLDYAATTSLALNSGTIRDAATNNATRTLASPGAAGSLGATKALVIDTTAPTVTGVSSSLADGSYTTGQVVPVTVTFSESVTVTGTPQLTLTTGSPATTAVNYTSGTGTTQLIFNYTVAAGNTSTDLDYAATTSLALNSGTIKDLATNNATLTLASPAATNSLGANKNLVISAG